MRPYQAEAFGAITEAREKGKSLLYVAPTGTGKTVVFANDILRAVADGQRVLVLAHRRELLDQAVSELAALGVAAEIERGSERARDTARVVVASVQTMRHKGRLARYSRSHFGTVVIDEAHHATADSYRAVLDHFSGAFLLGVTATPDRLDRARLDMFDDVYEFSIGDAQERGWLCPVVPRGIFVEGFDVSGIRAIGGRETRDLNQRELAKVAMAKKALDGVVSPLLKEVGDRRTLLFAVSVEHAKELARRLNRKRKGVARAVWGGDRSRDKKIGDFGRGKTQILVNVNLLTEGYNDPAIECIAMVRPTRSRALFAQMIGRGLRTHEGKNYLLVLDFCGNAGTHALVTPSDVLAPGERPEVVAAANAEMARAGNEEMTFDRALEIAKSLPENELVRYRICDGLDWDAQPLGAVSDAALARTIGVSSSLVSRERRRRGIAPSRGRTKARVTIDWSEVDFGDTDAAVASRIGASKAGVAHARKRLGIEPHGGRRRHIDWDSMPLGDVPDADIAREAGVHHSTVTRARLARGIRPFKKDGVQWDDQPLGIVPDREIANALGVSRQVVQQARSSRGIGPSNKLRIDWSKQPLGKAPDTTIAKGLGVSKYTVRMERGRRGIPPFRPSGCG